VIISHVITGFFFLVPIILSVAEVIGILANLGKGGEIVNLAFPWVDKS